LDETELEQQQQRRRRKEEKPQETMIRRTNTVFDDKFILAAQRNWKCDAMAIVSIRSRKAIRSLLLIDRNARLLRKALSLLSRVQNRKLDERKAYKESFL